MLLDRLTQGIRPYLLLSVVCLGLFAPGLASLPPLDRDESRFIQATRQMLESGDFIRIRFQDEMRAKKPAGIYWLQAATVRALSHPLSTQVWPYRLPGALAAWAAVLMTFAFGKGLMGSRPALVGALLLASSMLLISEAHQAKTDAVLLACVVAAQGALGRMYVSSRAMELRQGPVEQGRASPPDLAETMTFWMAQGLGILIKGPIVPMVSLLTILALVVADRSGRWLLRLRPITGFVLTAAIAAPWFVAVSKSTDSGFVGTAIKTDLLPKLLGAQEAHGGFPGLYLVLALLLMWPASLVVFPALGAVWADRKRLVYRFLLAWAIPTWLVFELIPTKLPHYVLPVFPALMLIAGAKLSEGLEWNSKLGRGAFALLWTAVGLAVAAATVLLPMKFGEGFDAGLIPISAAIALATAFAAYQLLLGHYQGAILGVMLTALAAWPALLQRVAPALDQLWVSRAVKLEVDTLAIKGPAASAGFSEPSIVFLLGTKTLLTDGTGAASFLAEHRDGVAIIEAKQSQAFESQAALLGLNPKPVGDVHGLNYSHGKPANLTLYQVSDP
jgi:4-amino-4-deoxy-L-arabinose transferase-like glycosyltransferase